MANEIANLVHAQALLALNSASNSEILKGFGIRSLERVVDGEFRVQLEQPVSFFEGQVLATPIGDTARIVAATLTVALPPYEIGDVRINTWDAAGAAVNGTGLSLTVLRFPTTG